MTYDAIAGTSSPMQRYARGRTPSEHGTEGDVTMTTRLWKQDSAEAPHRHVEKDLRRIWTCLSPILV